MSGVHTATSPGGAIIAERSHEVLGLAKFQPPPPIRPNGQRDAQPPRADV